MLSFYQFYPRQIITPDPNSAYFIRDFEATYLSSGDIHNPEWYIQQKIKENADGYFDFSKSMIDIGACYGTYSFTLPFKHSYMFEPNKEYCAYCHANMLLQGRIYDADIFNMAVSNESGTIRFDGYNGGERASEYNAWTNTPCADVPCVGLMIYRIDSPTSVLSRSILKVWSRMRLWVPNRLSWITTIHPSCSKAGRRARWKPRNNTTKESHCSTRYSTSLDIPWFGTGVGSMAITRITSQSISNQ